MKVIEGTQEVVLTCALCGARRGLMLVDATQTRERVVVSRTMDQLIKDSAGIVEGMEPGSALEAYNTTWALTVVGPLPSCDCRRPRDTPTDPGA